MQALKHMQQDKTERGAALREAGMRQHDRIIDAASAVRCCAQLQACMSVQRVRLDAVVIDIAMV